MTLTDIYQKLVDRFGEDVLTLEEIEVDPAIRVQPDAMREVASFLATDPELKFDSLSCLSGVDPGTKSDELWVVYHLSSMTHHHSLVLKAVLPKEDPRVPSVEQIWRTANWHEREAFDLFGIVFEGHPDLKRILLPDDWEGHPLRKDYEEPEFYHGMRVPY